LRWCDPVALKVKARGGTRVLEAKMEPCVA
jgi:hypothetical protein